MAEPKLFMVLLGCKPHGRLTEQHDVFFGIGTNLAELIPDMNAFWPDSGGLHIDAWRELTHVNGYEIKIVERKNPIASTKQTSLFFINLGGYKANEFEEFHFKTLCVANDSAGAIKQSKNSEFFKSFVIKSAGGASHIDDKYGFDLDDLCKVEDALSQEMLAKYEIQITKDVLGKEDQLNIGYLKLSTL